MNAKKICDFFCNHRNLALMVAGASLAALCAVWIMQYGFNLQPCHLCLLQRKPYMANIAIGLLAFAAAKKHPRAAFVLLLLAGCLFMIDMYLSFHHFGIEQKWWPLDEGCESTLPDNASLEDLKKFLSNRPITNCGQPAFVLFGISLTGYNFLLSTFLTAFTFFHAIKGHRCETSPKA